MSVLLPGGILTGRTTLRNRRTPTDREAMDMCKGFGAFITALYPGYVWLVGMRDDMVHVQNMNLNKKQGFVMHLSDIDVDGKALMRAAGELLERYGMKRGKRGDMSHLKRDIRGDAFQV